MDLGGFGMDPADGVKQAKRGNVCGDPPTMMQLTKVSDDWRRRRGEGGGGGVAGRGTVEGGGGDRGGGVGVEGGADPSSGDPLPGPLLSCTRILGTGTNNISMINYR